jgi:hypothetical protein
MRSTASSIVLGKGIEPGGIVLYSFITKMNLCNTIHSHERKEYPLAEPAYCFAFFA